MSCSIIRNPGTGEVEQVLAPNGQPSKLYQDILASAEVNNEKETALNVWSYFYSSAFKSRVGDWEKAALARQAERTFTLTDSRPASKEIDLSYPVVILQGTVIDGNNRLRLAVQTEQKVQVIDLNSYEDLVSHKTYLEAVDDNPQVKRLLDFLVYPGKYRKTYIEWVADPDTAYGDMAVERLETPEQTFDRLAAEIITSSGSYGEVTVGTASIPGESVPQVVVSLDENGEPLLEDLVKFLSSAEEEQPKADLPSNKTAMDVLLEQPLSTVLEDIREDLYEREVNHDLTVVRKITDNLDEALSLEKTMGLTDGFWTTLQKKLQLPAEQLTVLAGMSGNNLEEKLNAYTKDYEDGIAEEYFQADTEEKQQAEEPYSMTDLDQKILRFLEKIKVSVQSVDRIHDREGKPLSVTAKADMLNRIIQVVEGRMDMETLPEEAAHFFVEMLGEGHPLYKQMESKITGYKLYSSVVERYKNFKSYRNPDGTLNISKLKKEAIGQLIMQHVINLNNGNETPQKIQQALSWFQKVWQFIKGIFSAADTNPFEDAARQILDADTSNLSMENMENMDDMEYYRAVDPVAGLMQDQVNLKLDDTVDVRTGQKRHDYYYMGKKLKGSVTSWFVDPWLRRRYPTDRRSDLQKSLDLIKAEVGDQVHLQMRMIIESWTNPDGTRRSVQKPISPIIHNAFYLQLNNYIQQLMALYDENTRFFAEVKIHDPKLEIGGSIDLMIVDGDGVVDIYDWKSQEIFKGQDDIKAYKEPMYRIQLEAYRRILEKQYGFKKFGTVRAIPIKTQFAYKDNMIIGLRGMEIGNLDPTQIPDEKNYLLPVTLRGESTGNEDIDDLLKKLNAIYDKLERKRYSKEEAYKRREELGKLRLVIRDLQLRNRLDQLIEMGWLQYKKYKDKLKEGTLTGKEILEARDILEVFSTSGLTLFELRDELEEAVRESGDEKALKKFNDLNRRLEKMNGKVGKLIKDINKYRDEQTVTLAEKNGITNLMDAESPVGFLRGLFSALSNIPQKSFRLFSRLLRSAQNQRDNNFESTARELIEQRKKLEKWASGKGLSVNQAMDKLLETDKNGNWDGNFLRKYDKEASMKWTEAARNGDTQWLADNLDWDEDKYKQMAERELKNIREYQYAIDEKENKEIVERKVKEWELSHKVWIDGKLNFEALRNRGNRSLKLKDKYLTPKWLEMEKPGNEVLKETYELFQKILRHAEKIGMLDYGSFKFIPSVYAGKMESITFGNMTNLFKPGVMNDLQVESGTPFTPEVDPVTGEIINRLPVYFTKDLGIKLEDGSYDYSKKSKDLFRVFGIWSAHMYNYEAMKSIEDQALMVVETEKVKKSLVTDQFGNPVIENGVPKTVENNQANAKMLEDFVNYYLYDKLKGRQSDVEYKLPWGKKVYSLTKTVQSAMQYFSLKVLGLNLTSAAAQFAGGTGNVLFQAQKGQHITMRSWAKAAYLFTSSKKARAALDYFNVLQEGNRNQLIDEMSVSTLGRYINVDNAFIAMRGADKAVQYPMALAMMLEHMLDDQGNIISIQKFVKDKYNYNTEFYNLPASERQALKKKIEDEVGKLQDEKSLLAVGEFKDGKFSLPGFDKNSETMAQFRSKIKGLSKRILGNQTRDDINGIRTTLWGMSVMQFRNWIPEMIEERFDGLTYDDELQTWTYGRYNQTIADMFSKRLPKLVKALAGGLGTNAIELAKEKYQLLKAEAYEKGKEDEFAITEGEFVDLYIGNLRAMLGEALMISGVVVTTMSLTSTGDDDDTELKGLKKYAQRVMKKIFNEFAFYYNPIEFKKLLSNSVPMLGLLQDVAMTLDSLVKEVAGQVSGDEDMIKKAKPMKNLIKFLPTGKEVLLIMSAIDDDFRKEWDIRLENYFY